MSRRLFIAGNWKMNHNLAATMTMLSEFKQKVADVDAVDMAICPPLTALLGARQELEGSNIMLGAQNVHWEESGAFTGEVSASMLRDWNVIYAIVGHSERRHIFGETNEMINQRLRGALAGELKPILCCGELLEERRAGQTTDVVTRHVQEGLAAVSAGDMANVTIAYEPVWAIGTGETATPAQAQEVHAIIRGVLLDIFDPEVAAATRIQYGGSVKPENVAELMVQEDIDGALVGGASLKADDFAQLIRNAC